MKHRTTSGKILAGVLLAGSLLAWSPQDSRPAESPTYEVWQAAQPLFEHPLTFSRRLASLPRGTGVRLLEEPGDRRAPRPWGRVAVSLGTEEDPEERTGWLLLTPRQRRAGELAPELGGAAAPTGLALAAKALVEGLETLNRNLRKNFPSVEAALQALEAAWLDPAEVESFAREAGLKVPQREVR